jgi:hypothetical protein
MAEHVREIIIEPMLELYLPPQHLRADDQTMERAIHAYERALSGFDRELLC